MHQSPGKSTKKVMYNHFIGVNVTETMATQLMETATEQDRQMSEVIRDALRQYLQEGLGVERADSR